MKNFTIKAVWFSQNSTPFFTSKSVKFSKMLWHRSHLSVWSRLPFSHQRMWILRPSCPDWRPKTFRSRPSPRRDRQAPSFGKFEFQDGWLTLRKIFTWNQFRVIFSADSGPENPNFENETVKPEPFLAKITWNRIYTVTWQLAALPPVSTVGDKIIVPKVF